MNRAGGTLADEVLETEPQVHRLSVDDVWRMFEAGVLGDDDRVELLDGVLYDLKMSASPEHEGSIAWLNRRLVSASIEVEVRVNSLFFVEGGFVSPDLVVVDPVPARDRFADTAHLAVEVSVTSQRHDHAKARRYAGAGVTELWIVDLPSRTVFVHRQPRSGAYAAVTRLADGDRLPVPFGDAELDVTELLGPAG